MKKESLKKGGIVISIVLALGLFLFLSGNDSSITGYAIDRGVITTEAVDVVVGQQVQYSGVCSVQSCSESSCLGDVDGSNVLTINATGLNTDCECSVTTQSSGCLLSDTVTLNIQGNNCTNSTGGYDTYPNSCQPETDGVLVAEGDGFTPVINVGTPPVDSSEDSV